MDRQTNSWPGRYHPLWGVVVFVLLVLAPTRNAIAADTDNPIAPIAGAKALKPEVRFDILKHQLDEALREKNTLKIIKLIDELRKTGIALDSEILYQEARAYFEAEQWEKARKPLIAYLNTAGRKGAHYKAAIALFVSLERKRKQDKSRAQNLDRAAALWKGALKAYEEATKNRKAWRDQAKTLGGALDDVAWDLVRAEDGGFVIAGSYQKGTGQKSTGGKDGAAAGPRLQMPWLTGVDAKGRMAWFQPLGTPGKGASLRSAAIMPADKAGQKPGYLLGGLHKGFQIAARTDSRGRPLTNHEGNPWVSAFARADHGAGGIVRRAIDGSILAIGTETTGEKGPRHPFMIRLAANGKTLGKTVYTQKGAANWYDIADAAVLKGGGIVLGGELRADPQASVSAGFILYADETGAKKWSHRLAPTKGKKLRISAVAAAPDGGIIVAGHDGDHILVAKFDSEGAIRWQRRRPPMTALPQQSRDFCVLKDREKLIREALAGEGAPSPQKIAAVHRYACAEGRPFASVTALVTRKGGTLVLGFQGRGKRDNADIRLMAIDESGRIEWQRLYGHDGFDLPTAALETSDHGFIIAGATDSAGSGGRDFLLFKIDPAGALAPWENLDPPAKPKAPPRPPAKPQFLKQAKKIATPDPAGEPAEKKAAIVKAPDKPRGDETDKEDAGQEEGGTDFTATGPDVSEEPPETTLGKIFGADTEKEETGKQ